MKQSRGFGSKKDRAFINNGREDSDILRPAAFSDLFFLLAALIFFFTVLAAVDLTLLVGKEEYLIESLLDRGDTARVFAGDDIHELLRKIQLLLCRRSFRLDDIDRDAVVNEAKHVQIQLVDRALDLDNVLFPILLLCAFLMIATQQSILSSFRYL